MMQADSTLSPTQIYTAIQQTAAPMSTPVPDPENGYGFIQAGAALAWPSITVSPTVITVGESATLTWKAISLNTCTGSFASGTVATSGTMTVTPTSAVAHAYKLSCSNAAGAAQNSVTLQVGRRCPRAPLAVDMVAAELWTT